MGRISPKPVFASRTWVTTHVSGSVIADDQSLQDVTNIGNTTTDDITAANLKSNANIYANHNGGDGDSFVYFYEGSATGRHLKWADGTNRFEFNDSLVCDGDVVANTDMYINYADGAGEDGDGHLYFYENDTALGAYLMWDDNPGIFKLSHDLDIAGNLTVDSLEIDQTPTSGSITPDVYITLTVQQPGGTNRTIRIAGEMI